MHDPTLYLSFLEGILAFFSPCILPILPGFLAYLAGASFNQAKTASATTRAAVFTQALFFVLGFTLVFSVFGVLIASVFSGFVSGARLWAGRLAGVLIILFGLYLLGVIKLSFLQKESRKPLLQTKYRTLTSFLLGASFAFGWSPCMGPILASALALASTQPAESLLYMLTFSLGLGIPFLLLGFFISEAFAFVNKIGKYLSYFNIAAGVVLVIIGILVLTGILEQISSVAYTQAGL